MSNYVACLPAAAEAQHFKTIVNTRFTERAPSNPHDFEFNSGKFAVLAVRTRSCSRAGRQQCMDAVVK